MFWKYSDSGITSGLDIDSPVSSVLAVINEIVVPYLCPMATISRFIVSPGKTSVWYSVTLQLATE